MQLQKFTQKTSRSTIFENGPCGCMFKLNSKILRDMCRVLHFSLNMQPWPVLSYTGRHRLIARNAGAF